MVISSGENCNCANQDVSRDEGADRQVQVVPAAALPPHSVGRSFVPPRILTEHLQHQRLVDGLIVVLAHHHVVGLAPE